MKHALLKNWQLIEKHHVLNQIFQNGPLIAFKRAPTLKDLLVRSKYTSSDNSQEIDDMDELLLDALIKAL